MRNLITKFKTMKNVIKFSACILLAAVVGLSSCVKNEVSPEVTNLRKGQVAKLAADVAKLNADIELILANADYRLAETTSLELANAYKEANDAFILQETEAQLVVTLAQFEADAVAAQADLEAQKLAYEQAVVAYDIYITAGAFAESVTTFLGEYQDATGVLGGLYSTRLTLLSDIAYAQLLLTSAGGDDSFTPITDPITWDAQKARLEAMLADKNSKLTATEAALEALVNAYSIPADLQAEKDVLAEEIAALKEENLGFDTEIKKIDNELIAPLALQEETQAVLDSMDLLVELLDEAIADSTDSDWNTVLADSMAILAEEQIPWGLVNSTYQSVKTELASAESALAAKVGAYNTAEAALFSANNSYNSKVSAATTAANNLIGVLPTAPNYATLTAAKVAADLAVTTQAAVVVTAQAAFDALDPAVTAAEGLITSIEVRLDAALAGLCGTYDAGPPEVGTLDNPVSTSEQGKLDAINHDIDHINSQIEILSDTIAVLNEMIADFTDAYDEAAAAIDDADAAVSDLEDARKEFTDPQGENLDMIDQLEGVVTTLTDHVNNIEGVAGVIALKKADVEELQDGVASLEEQIATNVINKAWAEGEIIRLEARLALLETEITTQEAVVDSWKTLLDEAIAGN